MHTLRQDDPISVIVGRSLRELKELQDDVANFRVGRKGGWGCCVGQEERFWWVGGQVGLLRGGQEEGCCCCCT